MKLLMALACITTTTGCALAVPYSDCGTQPDVAGCETKAIRREDHRVLRKEYTRQRSMCVLPYIWDDRSRRCKTWYQIP